MAAKSKKNITLTFNESDPIHMLAYEYLTAKNRGKTKYIVSLISEDMARKSVIDEIKIQVLQEIMDDALLVDAIRNSTQTSAAESPEESKERASEEKEPKEAGLDMSFLMQGAAQFMMQ